MTIRFEDLSPEMQAKVNGKAGKRSKYGARSTVIDGIRFDSVKEGKRYRELKYLLSEGEISDLKLQHTFTLQEAFKTPTGEKVDAIRYIADFTYYQDGIFVIEDVKGFRTDVYRLKKKMMAEKGYHICEV